ncbi:MAG TPA: inositol monophosphatase family protein [Rhodopila sp.]|jgi:ADP-ribosylglycohydrolase/fructose-1,6-bisphosphatase/inositol monophosphatase family enzyme
MTAPPLPAVLPTVIDLVQQAGAWLAAEFGRPDGPRFSDTDSAPIDREVELFLRKQLTGLLPARFVGEEEGVLAAEANGFCWVVDPHDGTRAFLEGRRGSAISVGLLHRGIPVLGVVYAPTSPDRGPDLIAWVQGGEITRNGSPVPINLSRRDLAPADVVFLNHGAGQRPVWSSTACAPARFMPLPSIAYRLARVAVGDGIATLTLRPVNAHDIAAGHALLIAAGGVLVAEDGLEVTYGEHGGSRPFACFGGAPAAVAALRARKWRGATEPRRDPKVTLTWPRMAEGQRFDRALGCMLGLLIGDSLGSQLEFQAAETIRAEHPAPVTDLASSPVWQTQAGQPTAAGELGLTLARSLVRMGRYDAEDAATAYGRWYASEPFDCGHSSRLAFGAAAAAVADKAQAARSSADRGSQGNGSLTRIAPIGVWARNPDEAAHFAGEDSFLSHPHPICRAACAALAAAISAALFGADRARMMATALRVADAAGAEAAPVVAALHRAAAGVVPVDFQRPVGLALTSLQNAFFHLAADTRMEPALIETVGRGGDAADNAAIVGALLGAADGRGLLPVRWAMPVLTCRPDQGLHPARPRPDEYWPDDLLDLTEALLLSRAPS